MKHGVGESSSVASARAALDIQGFAVMHAALDPDWVNEHRPALREYVLGHLNSLDAESRAVGASAATPTFTLRDAPAAVADFVTSSRLGALAASLLDVPAVRLLHFCGFFKPGGGRPTPRHRDRDFIPLDTDRVLTAWIPLVPVDREMGGLVFVAGSHLDETHGAAGEESHETDVGFLAPGDISFHLGGTLHGARTNSSQTMREAVAVCFYEDGARIAGGAELSFRAALQEHYFPALRPGDLAAGPYNPVIYRDAVTEDAG
jgi:ectoine hydroxylase-related dioxygenase (phytanoyl-CoA dioxygenase family)